MHNPGGISLKSILIKSALSILVLGGIFFSTIWILGDENLLHTEPRKIPILNQVEAAIPDIESPASTNLTSGFSAAIAKKIVDENPSGPQMASGQIPAIQSLQPEEIVAKALEEASIDSDLEQFRPEIDIEDIRLNSDTSLDAQIKYFEATAKIYEENFFNISISQAQIQSGDLQDSIEAFKKSREDLLSLAVPEIIAEFHIQSIVLAGFQEDLLRLVANYQEDPLMALLAFEKIVELSGEVDDLNEKTNQYIERHLNEK